MRLPFKSTFNVVTPLDCLEHFEDDISALKQIASSLKVGGFVILTVPAHAALWSYSDVVAMHYRRYSKRNLEKTIYASGLEPIFMSFFMMPLLPLAFWRHWLTKRVANFKKQFRRDFMINPAINLSFYFLVSWESHVIRHFSLPIGTSIIAVARRPT